MIGLPHLLVGGVIGSLVADPLLVFIYAFLSHFVLDAIPHAEPSIWTKAKRKTQNSDSQPRHWNRWEYIFEFFEISLGIIILFLLSYTKREFPLILLGAFSSSIPDICDNTPFLQDFFRQQKWWSFFSKVHRGLHFSINKSIWGYLAIPTSLIVIFYAIMWLK